MNRKMKVKLANQLLDDYLLDFFDIDGHMVDDEMDYFLKLVHDHEVDPDERPLN